MDTKTRRPFLTFGACVAASVLASVLTTIATTPPPPMVVAVEQVAEAGRPVWVTRTGERFHRADCPSAKAGMITTAEAALRNGYTPCKTCRP